MPFPYAINCATCDADLSHPTSRLDDRPKVTRVVLSITIPRTARKLMRFCGRNCLEIWLDCGKVPYEGEW